MKNQKELYKKVCEYLGCDLDSTPCKQIQEYLKVCRNCKVYVNKIKKTVNIYKVADSCDQLPDDVCKKLFITLDLNNSDQPEESSEKD